MNYTKLSHAKLKEKYALLLASNEALTQKVREHSQVNRHLKAELDQARADLRARTPDAVRPTIVAAHQAVSDLCAHPDAPWLVSFLADQRNSNLQSAETHDKLARETNADEHYSMLRRARGHASVFAHVLAILEP